MPENDSIKPELTTKPKILELAERVPDPRRDKFKKHPLASMLFISLVGNICGADAWVAISDTGEHLEDWTRQYVELPFGTPKKRQEIRAGFFVYVS